MIRRRQNRQASQGRVAKMNAAFDGAYLREHAAQLGSWHEHTCCDCHAPYACSVAHGEQAESRFHRCEPCADQRY